MKRLLRCRAHGLTLIETLVAVLVVGVLVAIAAPSMQGLIAAQRVKGINAELVTDLQFARSEASRRNRDVLRALSRRRRQLLRGLCRSCRLGRAATAAGRRATSAAAGSEEIKTVKIPTTTGVAMAASSATGRIIIFERLSGSSAPDDFRVSVDSARRRQAAHHRQRGRPAQRVFARRVRGLGAAMLKRLPTKRASAPRLQRGLSIVELMVGVAIGMFVAAGAATLLVAQLGDNRRLLLETQVQQDLRATADIVGRELRRAGHWARARDAAWFPGAAALAANPYAAVTATAGGADFADGQQADSVLVSYSRADSYALEDGLVLPAERLGFRLQGGVVQTALGEGNWQALTDANTLNVTTFLVTMNKQQLALACSKACPVGALNCPPVQEVRLLTVDYRRPGAQRRQRAAQRAHHRAPAQRHPHRQLPSLTR